jgi:ABC-2 type transport system ATP-binding protein
VLHEVSVDVPRASLTGILGPNGAGKTTLLAVITGLQPISSGAAWVLGERLPARGARLRRRIGVVLQQTALYEELTVSENLRFAASLYSVPQPKRRIETVLELLGLEHRAGDVASTLSGGLRRRLAIARALLHEPELLVVDEPTVGLDAEARHGIWGHLRLLRSRGCTVIVATNYLDEVEALCERAAVLREGSLVAYEAPESLARRAGRRLIVDCASDALDTVRTAAAAMPGVTGIEATPGGASISLAEIASPDEIMCRLLSQVPVSGFRVRAADLAEVFDALGPPSRA